MTVVTVPALGLPSWWSLEGVGTVTKVLPSRGSVSEEAMPEAQRELATYDDPDVQFCVVGGVDHDYRPHTARSQFGPYERTYWRCVWCHGVTCGDYDEDDPCWLPYHHRTPHRTRSGVTWPVGGNPPGEH